MRTPLFDAVLFDLDGTLVDSVEDIAGSVNHARFTMGEPPLPVVQVRAYVGDGIRTLMERAFQTRDPEILDRAVALWKPHYTDHCLDHSRPYPGIEDLLCRAAGRGLPMGVVSNKLESLSAAMLEGLGLGKFFGAVVGGDSTPQRKPDPEPLRFAAARLTISSNRILVVGDSPNDILAARAAGYASCGVLWGLGTEEAVRAARPDHVARTTEDVVALLGV